MARSCGSRSAGDGSVLWQGRGPRLGLVAGFDLSLVAGSWSCRAGNGWLCFLARVFGVIACSVGWSLLLSVVWCFAR